MKRITIDVADMKISNDEDEILIAPSLGSCVAVSAYDPQIHAGGLIICMLPVSSEIEVSQIREQTFMFADTGLPAFFKAVEDFGFSMEQLKIVIAGGGQILGQKGDCDLGTRNCDSISRILASLELVPTHQSIGGSFNRTLELEIKTGIATISIAGDGIEKI
ncbi:MAG: chemotaxis protein CheD [Desulfobacteraceae bacterium]|nr:chemotaxis protein CheD [Desulfobacteraceae bacterium]